MQPLECTIEGWCDAESPVRSGPSRLFGCYFETFISAPCFWCGFGLPLPGFPRQPPLAPRTSRSLLLTGVAMGCGQREPCFVRRSAPVPSFPLLPAAEGHKKKRVGFSPREMMRSKCFLGSSRFLFWFGVFACISLLPPLSRKPLLPHLRGICFTQRAPGAKSQKQTQRQLAGAAAWEIPCRFCCRTAASGCDLGAADHGEGQEGRLGQGAALPGRGCNAQRPGERGG